MTNTGPALVNANNMNCYEKVEESHSKSKLLLETAPLLWSNAFAITILNPNNDCNLNIVDTEAIPTNIEGLCNDRDTVTTVEHTQHQYDSRKRKVSSTESSLNSSLTSFKVRKYYRESAENLHLLLDPISPIEEINSSDNEDLFSDIFDDIAVAQEQHGEEPSQSITRTDDTCISPSTLKKPRLSKISTLTRSFESFTDISLITLSTTATSTDLSLSGIIEPLISTEEEVSEHSKPTIPSVTVSDNSIQEATDIIKDSALTVDSIFPNIPTSISISTCSSTDNLSQISTPDAQGSKNSTIVSIDEKKSKMKDVYGWFVNMDHNDILRNPVNSTCDLSFSASTAPKHVVDDDELEWEHAADTVDCLLGDVF